MLYEDNTVRRTEETLKLWEEICNSKCFGGVGIILFLNKYDIFKEKIKRVDMRCAFPDYDGGCDCDAAKQFLKAKFLSLKNTEGTEPFIHFTNATDTKTMQHIFDDVLSLVVRQAMTALGFDPV